MAEASTVAAIARVDILARSAEEAERKAFKAAAATLIKGQIEVQFAGEVELSARNAAQSGKGMAATEEGRSPFGHPASCSSQTTAFLLRPRSETAQAKRCH